MPHRIVLRELERFPSFVDLAADLDNSTGPEIFRDLRELNDNLRTRFDYSHDPIACNAAGDVRVDGIAGLVRLTDNIELEIIPKFLSEEGSNWRIDFFVLATLVQTGHLLVEEELSSDASEGEALVALVARALLSQIEENDRRSIRSYRRQRYEEFSFDGDVDWESLGIPGANGYALQRLVLGSSNAFNATLLAALEVLIPEASSLELKERLVAKAQSMRPQAPPPVSFPVLPPRLASWSTAYELAKLVVNGAGFDMSTGKFHSPGFVISTWQAWQEFCENIVRRAFSTCTVTGELRIALGTRFDPGTNKSTEVCVYPDIHVASQNSVVRLMDAKYKTRIGRKPSISSADLYEGLAFMNGAGANQITLIYPSTLTAEKAPTGSCRHFERIRVGDRVVDGVMLQVQGLAQPGGIAKIIEGIFDSVTTLPKAVF